jgi:hypothetical protein
VVQITSSGSFDKTEKFLLWIKRGDLYKALDAQAQRGVAALASATPVDSGLTAASWGYKIRKGIGYANITWTNRNIHSGFPVAIMLQFGHGTGTGGYVQGRDYINPAIRPVFDDIANSVWRAVTSALWPASTRESSR